MDTGGYWNYVMLPHHAALPPIPRPVSQAETLKAILSRGKPPTPSPPPPPQVVVTKRIVHQIMKPPLFVSNQHKAIGQNIFAREITDPSVSEDDELRHYLMCGACDSKRLFRSSKTLIKHRQTSNCPTTSEETMTDLIAAARKTLESLSIEQIISECDKNSVPIDPNESLSKPLLIDRYLSHTVCPPPSALLDSQETVPAPDIDITSLVGRATEVRKRFPGISSHMLAVALVAGLVPEQSEIRFCETQTHCSEWQSRETQTDQAMTETTGTQTLSEPVLPPKNKKRKN